MTQTIPNAKVTTSRLACRSARSRRKGYVSVFSILLIVIAVATLVLVVDWTFLVFSSRRTLQLTDTLALTAVSELLDDGRLLDEPLDQSDDVIAASTVITTPATGFLARNNEVLPSQLQVLDPLNELTIDAAHVDDTSEPVTGLNFNTSPVGTERYNSLRVEIFRDPNGSHPVQLLMRGFGAPDAAKISGSAIATIDSRVVGYRPQANAAAPVAPLALSRGDWESTRASQPLNPSTDMNNNGRKEFDFVLKYSDGSDTANMAVLNVDSSMFADAPITVLQAQIEDGLIPADVDPVTGRVGPFSVDVPDSLNGTDVMDSSDVADLAASFNAVAASNDPRRVFLLYDTAAFPNLNITGFIAANILGATVDSNGMGGSRLRIRLEPAFIIHPTTETQRELGGFDVPENDYCHKIRVTR